MQTAVAKSTAPAVPAIAASAAASAASPAADAPGTADFAALLLGQMSAEPVLAALPETDPLPAEELAEDGSATDPTQLLAEMGLLLTPTPAATPSTAAESTDLPADTAGGTKNTATIPLALATSTKGAAKAGFTQEMAEVQTAKSPSAGVATPATNAPNAALPANFAGAEQKLAEPKAMPADMPTPASAAALAATSAQPSHAARAEETLRVATPVRDPAWAADFGQKVVWLATQDKQSAQITLNPPQMGPIEISLSVKNDHATAHFASANPEVREAIESSMPRLREMLAGVGVELGQTNVSAESFRQAQDWHGGHSGGGHRGNDGDGDVRALPSSGAVAATRRIQTGNGLVDTFA